MVDTTNELSSSSCPSTAGQQGKSDDYRVVSKRKCQWVLTEPIRGCTTYQRKGASLRSSFIIPERAVRKRKRVSEDNRFQIPKERIWR